MNNYIKFFGTAGGRFSVFNQIRASGGIWLSLSGTNILVDPGPGSLIKLIESGRSARNIDAIYLSHRHLDHSADINSVVESMTSGGRKHHGAVFAPDDAWDNDPVILKYNRNNYDNIRTCARGTWSAGNIKISTPLKLIHPVENFAVRFDGNLCSVGYISDTLYFEPLKQVFTNIDILIINTVFVHSRENIYHLSVDDVIPIVSAVKPKKAVITHFSTEVLRENPDKIAFELSKSGIEVIAAYDGMQLQIDEI